MLEIGADTGTSNFPLKNLEGQQETKQKSLEAQRICLVI